MPTDISIPHLIFNASIFVQFIMLVLSIMFLITLYITGSKILFFRRLTQKLNAFNKVFWSETDLETLFVAYQKRGPESIESLFIGGLQEFNQCCSTIRSEPNMIVNNCRRAMEAAAYRETAIQERWLNILATFGSSAPYIGLLGTVIGIMTSFLALAGAQQTSINSVAPGIAEALIATAIGLVAAIPSVLSYNYFINKSEALNVEYDAFIEEFSNLLQRQLMAAHEYMKHR